MLLNSLEMHVGPQLDYSEILQYSERSTRGLANSHYDFAFFYQLGEGNQQPRTKNQDSKVLRNSLGSPAPGPQLHLFSIKSGVAKSRWLYRFIQVDCHGANRKDKSDVLPL